LKISPENYLVCLKSLVVQVARGSKHYNTKINLSAKLSC